MRRKLIVLAVLLMATVAQAVDLTIMVGDEFVFSDVSLSRMGPFQVGVAAAIDYTIESENISDDFEMDFGSHYVGPIVKLHVLPEDDDWALYASYSALFENVDIDDDVYEILGATLTYKNWGISYQYYLSEYKMEPDPDNDRLMLTWTGHF